MIEEKLDRIIDLLSQLVGKKSNDKGTKAGITGPDPKAGQTAEAVVPTPSAPAVASAEPDKPHAFTVAEVGKALTNLCERKTATLDGDKKAGFAIGMALLQKFGAVKVSGLAESQYAAVMAAIAEAGK